MNQKERFLFKKRVWHSYHIPGLSHLKTLKMNACFISAANSLEHELAKVAICWKIKKRGNAFITEAARNKLDQHGKERRVDVVELETGIEYEIETTPQRAKRFEGESNVEVIRTWLKKG